MTTTLGAQRSMRYEDMQRALDLLDAQIAENDLLMSVAPLRLISAGGSLAVRLCFNREATYDIDCMLDPNVAAVEEYSQEFSAAVVSVAEIGLAEMVWDEDRTGYKYRGLDGEWVEC